MVVLKPKTFYKLKINIIFIFFYPIHPEIVENVFKIVNSSFKKNFARIPIQIGFK